MGKILGNFLSLVIGSIIIWLIVWFFFYKPEPKENSSLEDIYGVGAISKTDEDFVGNDTVILKEIISIDNEEKGNLYTIIGKGEYYGGQIGEISFKIALDNELVIIGYTEEKYEHSSGNFNAYVNNFLKELVNKKVKLDQFDNLGSYLDGITGPTAGSTTALLMGMLEDLKELVDDKPLTTPVEDIYGVGATTVEDTEFVETENIISKETVQLDGITVGSLYTISLTSTFQDNNDEEKTVTLKIALNNDLDILGHIEVAYGHTGGRFKTNVINFLNELVDTNLLDLVDLDGSTGSTNTTTGLITILYELKDLLDN